MVWKRVLWLELLDVQLASGTSWLESLLAKKEDLFYNNNNYNNWIIGSFRHIFPQRAMTALNLCSITKPHSCWNCLAAINNEALLCPAISQRLCLAFCLKLLSSAFRSCQKNITRWQPWDCAQSCFTVSKRLLFQINAVLFTFFSSMKSWKNVSVSTEILSCKKSFQHW